MAVAMSAGLHMLAAAGPAAGNFSAATRGPQGPASSSCGGGLSLLSASPARGALQPTAVLRNAKRQSEVAAEAVEVEIGDDREPEMEGSDPLPLVARAAAKQTTKSTRRKWNAVDWIAADRARDVLLSFAMSLPRYEWPKIDWSKVTLPTTEVEPEEAVAQEAVDESVFPRCAWPRQQPAARCNWPRVKPAVSDALAATSSRQEEEASLFSARCAWPKQITPSTSTSGSAASSTSTPSSSRKPMFQPLNFPERSKETEKEIESLERLFTSTPIAVGPHCAWPRSAGQVPAATAATAEEKVLGPRCAWPRTTAPAVAPVEAAVGPHCLWPRKASREL